MSVFLFWFSYKLFFELNSYFCCRFPVNRKIISESSEYFEVLLGPNFREGTANEITLKSVDGPTLKAIIGYIYTGVVELSGDNVESVLSAASGMELVSLERQCEKYLDDNLTEENCAISLLLADKYYLNQLYGKALAFVCEHFEKISTTDLM